MNRLVLWVSLLAPAAALPCTDPSATHVCVRHNGIAFLLDTGGGYQQRAALVAQPDVELTFEMDTGSFSSHPFILTTSPTGGSGAPIVAGPANASGATVTYTPTAANAGQLHYGCNVHPNMGAQILIDGFEPDAGEDAGTDAGTPDGGTTPDGGNPGGGDPPAGCQGCSAAPGGVVLLLALALVLTASRSRRAGRSPGG